MQKVSITTEFIRLDQFLKFADAVGGGGEAKVRIQYGEVKVNGVPETHRGRKLHIGDQVALDGAVYEVCGSGES